MNSHFDMAHLKIAEKLILKKIIEKIILVAVAIFPI